MVLRNPSLVFPIELLELVLNNLQIDNDDDQKSLISCSYANHILRIICQKRLFQNVVVTHGVLYPSRTVVISFFDYEHSTGYRFLRLLDASPHIGSYVRNITLEAVYLLSLPDADTTSSRDPKFSLHAILSRLQNLQKFDIWARGDLPWSQLDEPTKTLLRNLTQSVPVLDFLAIEDIPISFFYNSAALQELCLRSFGRHADPTAVLHTRAKLRALQIGHASESRDLAPNELLSWFQPASSPFDVTHLVDLALLSDEYWVSDIQGMLELCSNTLEKLDLQLSYVSIRSALRHQRIYSRIGTRGHSPEPWVTSSTAPPYIADFHR
ncbi:hypothetical protein GALMADRAFT_221124 [Galerina marginata CBS 339.88]|uniref:F-box domain-containing protein n=1 Tax=Galerina marginata (strain CBS 339.88) TaxID=685588 RepID=A0A067TW09_GALM3|nr:hypothetical protein GALMADRAFT_221124 [Galerina marginata CBS 339.88]